jgi:DNA uptake protein ComE-like DNA-binding protein
VILTTMKKFLKKSSVLDRFLLLTILLGAMVALVSLFRGIVVDRQVKVEYLNKGNMTSDEAKNKIFVDIEGAIIQPGVYELFDGSRIKDVMVMAGGLADGADRNFCEKNINMAELLKDGQKIYVPLAINTDTQQEYFEAMASSKKVSINSATVVELDTLWGIGSARAESIVKSRPYQSIDELVTKGVLTKSLVDRNRELLSVY